MIPLRQRFIHQESTYKEEKIHILMNHEHPGWVFAFWIVIGFIFTMFGLGVFSG